MRCILLRRTTQLYIKHSPAVYQAWHVTYHTKHDIGTKAEASAWVQGARVATVVWRRLSRPSEIGVCQSDRENGGARATPAQHALSCHCQGPPTAVLPATRAEVPSCSRAVSQRFNGYRPVTRATPASRRRETRAGTPQLRHICPAIVRVRPRTALWRHLACLGRMRRLGKPQGHSSRQYHMVAQGAQPAVCHLTSPLRRCSHVLLPCGVADSVQRPACATHTPSHLKCSPPAT